MHRDDPEDPVPRNTAGQAPTASEWFHDPAGLAALAPAGFTIGIAASAFPIEGAVRDDGREPSTWDGFMAQSDRIADGSTAAVAADHYHRVPEDVRLLAELGVDSYRFTLAWSRLQPDGRGGANREAVAFYDRLLDGLLTAGIRPTATLFDGDVPERLQHVGGWLNRDTALRFGDYAFLAGEAFGDRVDSWVTIDDPSTVTLQGYALGTDAPGARLGLDALPAAHHQLLAHGTAVQALRAADVRGGVGLALSHSPVEPSSDGPGDAVRAEFADALLNRLYADPVLLGRYPAAPEQLPDAFSALAEVDPDDLVTIRQPIDFLGLDYAGPSRVRAAPAGSRLPFAFAPWPEYPGTASGRPVAPEFLGVALRELGERYGDALPPVVVTRLGGDFRDRAAGPAEETGGPVVAEDEARASYLADHLAVAFEGGPGVDVRGVLLYTLLDGWEWAEGFSRPYGLVSVHPETQDRTPKRSYRWLQRMLGERSG